MLKGTTQFSRNAGDTFLSAIWLHATHKEAASLTMLIAALYFTSPDSHWEPPNQVGSQSLAYYISGIQSGNFLIPSEHATSLYQSAPKKF